MDKLLYVLGHRFAPMHTDFLFGRHWPNETILAFANKGILPKGHDSFFSARSAEKNVRVSLRPSAANQYPEYPVNPV